MMKVALLAGSLALGAGLGPGDNAPETFHAIAQARKPLGVVGLRMNLHIDRYLTDGDRVEMLAVLRSGGPPAFLDALRRAPSVGYVEVGDRRWTIRWAHEQVQELRRVIVVATDEPMDYFYSRDRTKPRTDYDTAVIRLEVDVIGTGAGTMAAAARVKPSDDGSGVQIDDYADEPVDLYFVTKDYSHR